MAGKHFTSVEERKKMMLKRKLVSIFCETTVDTPPKPVKWTSPKEIARQPKQIYFQYHNTLDDTAGFDIPPMRFLEERAYERGRKLSRDCKDILNKWNTFLEEITGSKRFMIHYPSPRNQEFRHYYVKYNAKAKLQLK